MWRCDLNVLSKDTSCFTHPDVAKYQTILETHPSGQLRVLSPPQRRRPRQMLSPSPLIRLTLLLHLPQQTTDILFNSADLGLQYLSIKSSILSTTFSPTLNVTFLASGQQPLFRVCLPDVKAVSSFLKLLNR
jgi:hypothetical protein